MEKSGVNQTLVKQIKNAQTGHAIIILNKNKDNVIIVHDGANLQFSELEVNIKGLEHFLNKPGYQNAKKIFCMEGWVNKKKNLELVSYFYEEGFSVYGDVSWPEILTNKMLRNQFNFVNPNYLEFINMIEQAGYQGTVFDEVELDEHKLQGYLDFIKKTINEEDWGFDLIVKVGSKGSVWFSENELVYDDAHSSPDHPLTDTTGAGDSFIAALIRITSLILVGPRKGWKKEEKARCLRFCNIAGMISCSKNGAQTGPTWEEITKFNF